MKISLRSITSGKMKPVIAFAGVVLVLTLSFALWRTEYQPEPSTSYKPVSAEIVSLAPDKAIHRIGERESVVVYAKASTGEIGMRKVAIENVEGCKVGNKIAAELKGIHLRLKPKPCRF